MQTTLSITMRNYREVLEILDHLPEGRGCSRTNVTNALTVAAGIVKPEALERNIESLLRLNYLALVRKATLGKEPLYEIGKAGERFLARCRAPEPTKPRAKGGSRRR